MAKKRSCRRTDEENRIHEKAVKLRKMTDEQLVGYVEDRAEKVKEAGPSIAVFLSEINSLHGIGAATVSKIKAYAKERGYLE